jgi:crossover junction endodeoxyribonuclease RuvC
MWNEFEKLFGLPGNHPSKTPEQCFIERVQAMPQQGGSSMFKFGYSAGFLRGIIMASRLPITMVEPQAWKKTAGISNGSDKKASITRACQLFPNETEQLMPKRSEWDQEACIGVADAALIGWYGLRTMGAASAPETYEDI